METRSSILDVNTTDSPMATAVTEPDRSGDWPVVAIFIDAPGMRPATFEFMDRLAGEGYRVITPDLHHRLGRMLHFEPKDFASDPEARPTIMGWIAAMTDEQIQQDLDDALAAAGVPAGRPIAVIGFCLGARAAVKAMMRLPDRVVAGAGWHPSFLADGESDSPHLTAATIGQPLYLGIGDADQVQSIAMHQPFLDAVADLDHIDVTILPGADHGYTWPGYPTHDEAAAETSWAKTLGIFAEAFG
jgi:carboxymethylenebutenolidase